MSDKTKTVRIPNVGEYVRQYGTLVGVEDVTPKEIILDYIFEETSARVEGRINGKVVKEYGTFNNFYGKDTCIENAISEAKVQQNWIGESNMEFVVVKITSRVRKRPSRVHKENWHDRQYRAMDTLDFGCRRKMPDDIEEVVWSSLSAAK